jgi:hypothetical protein
MLKANSPPPTINANGTRANAGERPPVPGIPGVLAVAGTLKELAETTKVSLQSEADALPLAEAEVEADVIHIAEATDANISAPIMDSPTNNSSFFTVPPSGRSLLRTPCYT